MLERIIRSKRAEDSGRRRRREPKARQSPGWFSKHEPRKISQRKRGLTAAERKQRVDKVHKARARRDRKAQSVTS